MIVNVQSTSGLLAALKTAQAGDTILVAPGTYSSVRLSGLNFNEAVTIQSADPAHQAIIKDLSVAQSSGLIFNQLDFTTTSGNAATISNGSSNITFTDSDFYGSGSVGNAMMIRDSGNVTVENSDLGNFGSGINELNSHHITITGNVFHDFEIQAIRGTGVTHQTIGGNTFADAEALVANHKDAIYLWQDNAANHVVVEANNIFGPSGASNEPTAPPVVQLPPAEVGANPPPSEPGSGAPTPPPTVDTGGSVSVSNTEQLLKALKAAHGGDLIKLEAGTYDAVVISNLSFDDAVTIQSADPAHQAVIKGLVVAQSSGLIFSELDFTTASGNAATISNGSSNITFTDSDFYGSGSVGNAMMIRDSGNVTVANSDLGNFGSGINELNSHHITITGNVFHDFEIQAIRGTGVTHQTIGGNTFADAEALVANHKDAIYLWQDNAANHVVVEANNIFGPSGASNEPTAPPVVQLPPAEVGANPPPSEPGSGAPTPPPTVDTGGGVSVSNTEQLLKALKAAHGGDLIKLEAGTYDAVVISNLNFDGAVTIQSADPAHQAVIKGLTISGSSGLDFERLEVVLNGDVRGVNVSNSANLSFSELHVHGAPGTNTGVGMHLRNAHGVTIKDSEVTEVGSGIGHITSNDITISNNYIHDVGTDGIFGGGSNKVVVYGNTITDFHPPVGAHPDAIQFYGYTGIPSSDVVISDNVITRGSGDPMQGIFIEGTNDIQITGNAMAGTMYNGIGLSTTSNALISNNFLTGFSDMGTRIITRGASADVTIVNNTAQEIVNYAANGVNPNYVQVGNTIIGGSAMGDLATMKAWLAQHVGVTSVLTGGDGSDLLTGTIGADNMVGGIGEDVYLVNHAGDVVNEALYGGVDTVKSTLSTYTLGGNVENLVLSGTTPQSGLGNGLNNVLVGNEVQSTLNGGAGADTLIATGGVNIFTGGEGADVFSFSKTSAPTIITDFTVGEDKVDLHELLARYHGVNPLGDTWIELQSDSAGVTLLVDVDGPTGSAGFTAVAKLSGVSSLSALDWVF